MRKIPIILFFLIYTAFNLQAQLHYLDFNNHVLDLKLINPAFTGFNDKINIVGAYQTSSSLSHAYLGSFDIGVEDINSGIGAYFYRDEWGIVKNNFINIAYRYSFKFNEGKKFNIGLDFNRQTYRLDDSDYFGINTKDPLLSDPLFQETYEKYDLNFGVAYVLDKRSFGFSVGNVLNNNSDDWFYIHQNYRFINFFFQSTEKINEWLLIDPKFILHHQHDYVYFSALSGFSIKNFLLLQPQLDLIFKDNLRHEYGLNIGFSIKDMITLYTTVYSNSDIRYRSRNMEFILQASF